MYCHFSQVNFLRIKPNKMNTNKYINIQIKFNTMKIDKINKLTRTSTFDVDIFPDTCMR